jgi:hypothetical protein
VIRGSGRGEEPSGEKVLRLIQIRFATLILEKSCRPVKTIHRECESPIPPQKRSQLFIGVHNKALSVVAMCIHNSDRAPV